MDEPSWRHLRAVVVATSDLHDPAADRSVRVPRVPVAAVPEALAERVLAVLGAPASPHETIAVAFARKEQAVAAVFATVGALEARALHRRLTTDGDPLASAFARLTLVRRQRLLAYLVDARRHAARMAA